MTINSAQTKMEDGGGKTKGTFIGLNKEGGRWEMGGCGFGKKRWTAACQDQGFGTVVIERGPVKRVKKG